MGSFQCFSQAITHWCFGITILIGLVSSEFSGGESILAIFIASCTSTLSAICNSSIQTSDGEYLKRKRLDNLLGFLIIWLDVLTNLVAAATCARLASATVDYITNGHFREFLFGLEQHSLGEPWPDVLGVTIVLVITVLFMMGLERSSVITILLILASVGNFAFFTFIGSFHTINNFQKWADSLKIRSPRLVLKAAAICSFAFIHKMPMTPKNNYLKIATVFFMPLIFYTVLTIIFSLMVNFQELVGTAIPLIQVFQSRDVDWARPVLAALTICVVCLLLTEILPYVYFSFVRLASVEWKVFVSSIQFQSRTTGAPVLAIFAAGSLTAILAFACPLSHLIKLLNVACLIKAILNSCQMVYTRYRPEIMYCDLQGPATSIQYSKLNQQLPKHHQTSLKERLKGLFGKTPKYIHKLSSPKVLGPYSRRGERERLIFDASHGKSLQIDIPEDSEEENEENEMEVMSCSDGEHSESSTDIDVIVEEYRERLRVTAKGQFTERKPSTKTTSVIVTMCLILIIVASISISLYVFRIIKFYWFDSLAILAAALIITGLPENASEKSKPSLLPSLLFPLFHSTSIALNTILAAMIVTSVWQGIVFWTIAGLLLYLRCDCCSCDVLEPLVVRATSKVDPQEDVFEYKRHLVENIVVAR